MSVQLKKMYGQRGPLSSLDIGQAFTSPPPSPPPPSLLPRRTTGKRKRRKGRGGVGESVLLTRRNEIDYGLVVAIVVADSRLVKTWLATRTFERNERKKEEGRCTVCSPRSCMPRNHAAR